jgi:hypothetical protein
VIAWAVSSVRGRVIVSVVHRVDSLAVHCLFTRSHSDKLSSSRILREDRPHNLLHALERRVHIIWYQSLCFLSRIVLVFDRIELIYMLSTNSQKENPQPKFIRATDFVVCFIEF